MSNADVHTLTGAYALDALDEFERRQFEAHLAECPECAKEVDELRATAARLGSAVIEPPPDHLRRQVLDQIAGTRQEGPRTESPARAQRPPRRWVTRLTAAAAAIALLAAVALGVLAVRAQQQLETAQGALAQAQSRYEPIAAVLEAKDARLATNTVPGVGSATTMSSHQLNRAVLVVSGMQAPPAQHVYQAWLIGDGGAPRPAGLLDLSRPLLVDALGDANVIKLTVEPDGGSPQPTTTPVMWVDVPA